MKFSISTWDHKCDAAGRILGGGQVEVKHFISFCRADGGCGIKGCNCSTGYWLTIGEGYNPLLKTSSGVTFAFPNKDRMVEFLAELQTEILRFTADPSEPMGV